VNDISIDGIQELTGAALNEIRSAGTVDALEALRVRYLGKKGILTHQLKSLGGLPPAIRRDFGQAVNRARDDLQEAIREQREALEHANLDTRLARDAVDVTLPGRARGIGGLHPITRTMRRMEDIFRGLGFEVADGPEIEDDFHNFEALNIPADHPARAMHDTFYLEDGLLLRTHTSPVQVRFMREHEPPIRVIAPGRVYRCDSDVTHTPMFNQIEGLAVDRNISFADLKGVLTRFIQEFFERELPVRFRPSYFPFTEPSAEVDMGCVYCGGSGCRLCKHTGWIEVLGCGMVHPAVFGHVGVDSERYTGFAFGLGVERFAMLRDGVDDLRLFFENDIGFLGQFR